MKVEKRKHFKREEWKRDLSMYFRPIGVIRLCLIMTGAALLCFAAIAILNKLLGNGTDSILYQVSFALSTGAIASGIVSIVVEMSNNYEKNRRRLRQLSDYFSIIASYEMRKRAAMRSYEKMSGEQDKDFGLSPWQEAIETFDNNRNDYAEEGEGNSKIDRTALEIAGIANQVVRVREVFKMVHDGEADMLTTEEYEEVSHVLLTIKIISDTISIALMADDGQEVSKYKKLLFLKEATKRVEEIAIKGKEQLIRLTNEGLKQASRILNKKDYFNQLDGKDIKEEVHEEDSELRNGIMEYVKMMEKMDEQQSPYDELAQKYLKELLAEPSYIDIELRIFICMNLEEFDNSMKLLKEYVKKEPLYGYQAEFFEKEHPWHWEKEQ